MSFPARVALAIGVGLFGSGGGFLGVGLPQGHASVPDLTVAGLAGFGICSVGMWAGMFVVLGAVRENQRVTEMAQTEERVFEFSEQDWAEPVRDGDTLRFVIRYRGRRRQSGPIEAIAERVSAMRGRR
jgi:hypothetical protein